MLAFEFSPFLRRAGKPLAECYAVFNSVLGGNVPCYSQEKSYR